MKGIRNRRMAFDEPARAVKKTHYQVQPRQSISDLNNESCTTRPDVCMCVSKLAKRSSLIDNRQRWLRRCANVESAGWPWSRSPTTGSLGRLEDKSMDLELRAANFLGCAERIDNQKANRRIDGCVTRRHALEHVPQVKLWNAQRQLQEQCNEC